MAIFFVYLHRVVADYRGGVVDIEFLDIFMNPSIDINDSHRSLGIFRKPVDNKISVILATTLCKRTTVLAR
jgi:hypothetical protein